jgi:2-polyprenyl-6-methoxyphenol hydroxylase-like FAD-dependent oxidoreductase
MADPHMLITGAGISGLLAAQALKKSHIPFIIFERDPTPFHRRGGWGLALHWALDTLLSLLPEHLQERINDVSVDPVASAAGERGRFPFIDLSTGEVRWENRSPKRLRVSREKLRALLLDGIDLQVSATCQTVLLAG